MKKLLFFLLFISFASYGQQGQPSGTLKLIQSPGFYYRPSDSTVHLYKGSTYLWNRFLTVKDSAKIAQIYFTAKNIPFASTNGKLTQNSSLSYDQATNFLTVKNTTSRYSQISPYSISSQWDVNKYSNLVTSNTNSKVNVNYRSTSGVNSRFNMVADVSGASIIIGEKNPSLSSNKYIMLGMQNGSSFAATTDSISGATYQYFELTPSAPYDVSFGDVWGLTTGFTVNTDFYAGGNMGMRIDPLGHVSIGGILSPLARFHLPAGSATAGTAPLKINSGPKLTTPENGAIENDGTHLYFTPDGGAQRIIDTGGTVTNTSIVSANGISGTVATPTTTPAITLSLGAITPTSTNGVSAATMAFMDATSSVQMQLNSKGSGTVTGVTGTAPIVSSGGTAPAISINAATTSTAGSMSAADKTKLDGIASGATANTGTVTSASIVTANGISGTVATASTTPAITLSLGAITPTSTNGVSAATMAFVDATSSIQTQLNSKGPGTVTGVTGTAPIVSSGGTAPAISINAATTSTAGSMSAADKTKLDGIAAGATANNGTVTSVTAGLGMTGGTFTTFGTVGLDTSNVNVLTRQRAANTYLGKYVTPWTALGYIRAADLTATAPILFNSGTGVTSISPATTSTAGSMSAADKLKLDGLTSSSGTVTSASIVTANGISGTVATATTTPAITLSLGAITPTSTNGVSAATMAFMDATSSIQTQLNSKGTVTGVTGTAPIVSSGGTAPAISINAATTSTSGSMSAADKTKLDGIASGATANTGTVTSASVVTANGISGTVATATTTPAITLSLGAITPTSTNGVSAATMAYMDATSSVQAQLNSKGTGNGTVTSASVVTANGISGTVATASTTPAITLSLGAITPTSTNGVSAATMAFMDATSSVQTQLNTKLQDSEFASQGIMLRGATSGAYSILADNSTNWNTSYTDRLKWDGGATGLTAATGRNSLGGTTVGQNLFTLTNPTAITFPRINADNTVSALDAATFRTAIGAGTSSTTGTVTSIATSGAISGGTITTTGTITHNTTDGFHHVPATGTTNNGKILMAGSTAGSESWQSASPVVNNHQQYYSLGQLRGSGSLSDMSGVIIGYTPVGNHALVIFSSMISTIATTQSYTINMNVAGTDVMTSNGIQYSGINSFSCQKMISVTAGSTITIKMTWNAPTNIYSSTNSFTIIDLP